jgi:hypothetical protein
VDNFLASRLAFAAMLALVAISLRRSGVSDKCRFRASSCAALFLGIFKSI